MYSSQKIETEKQILFPLNQRSSNSAATCYFFLTATLIFGVAVLLNLRIWREDANLMQGTTLRPSIYAHLASDKSSRRYYHLLNITSSRVFAVKRAVQPAEKIEPQDDHRLFRFRASGCPPVDRWTPSLDKGNVDFSESEFAGIRTPEVVHYIWLRYETYTFRNYLSILSVVRFLQPLKIVFHISERPKPDAFRYHQWWEEMLASLPNLVVRKTTAKHEASFAKQILEKEGGIIIPIDVIFLKTLVPSIKSIEIDKKKSNEVFASSLASSTLIRVAECFTLNWNETVSLDVAQQFSCIELPFEVYPHEFWQSDDEFGELIRFLFYGSIKPLQPWIDESSNIPAICHYVLIGGVEINFVSYLSILSCLYLGKADAVLIHGDMEPTGFRWNRLLEKSRKVKFIKQELPENVYGNEVSNVAHISYVWRVDHLLKYGGVYLDWNAVVLKPINSLFRYDTILSYDIHEEWKPFPHVFDLGIFAAKRNAPYLKFLKESMRYFYDEDKYDKFAFRYNSQLIPFKVYECFPDMVKVDPNLQVICSNGKCHPTWKNDFWRNAGDGVFSVHWTNQTPEELNSENALRYYAIKRNSSKLAVAVAGYILEASNIDIGLL